MKKISTPYLLLLPGFIFLFTFFILPIINLAQTSTQTPISGGDIGQYEQTFRFANYLDAFLENREQFSRSFVYAFIATLLALLISYPLAYALAFKAGRFKNILLVLVIAPFFTSFLLVVDFNLDLYEKKTVWIPLNLANTLSLLKKN
jgi:spermidine/putrescine transport system permease protein